MGFATLLIEDMDQAMRYRLVTSCTVPRPIAWVTTLSAAGVVNAAPFSSYNYIAHSPPMVAINIGSREGRLKDTARNMVETKEFVINLPTEESLDVMHSTSGEYGAEVSETEVHGIELMPSEYVKPPRIVMSPIHMECKLTQVTPLGSGFNTLYIGEIVAIHLRDDIFDGRDVDFAKLRPVARMGGPYYATIGELIYRERAFTAPGSSNQRTPEIDALEQAD
jgi:flavin reductase (DIM6/NTAB) family NADH-FMN oxidoreductase RutF